MSYQYLFQQKNNPNNMTEKDDVVAASFGKRLGAFIIDSILLSIPNIIIVNLTIGEQLNVIQEKMMKDILNGVQADMAYIMNLYDPILPQYNIILLVSFIINAMYYMLMEASSKQATVGKTAMKIKVVDSRGNKLSYGRALGRYFARIITQFTLLIGYFMMLFNKKSQTLHDMIASCLVIEER